jgi:GT2 family glycosyltransferase
MNSIAIVIANWQQSQLTINTIDSLKKIHSPNFKYHIFLVDNGSKDECPMVFSKLYSHDKHITLLLLPINYGFAVGNNFGIEAALKQKYSHILLINSDVIVHPDFLIELLKPFSNDSHVGIVGPKIYFAPGLEFHKDRYNKNEIGKVIWSAGGKMDWDNVYASNIGIDEVDNRQYDKPNNNLEFITFCCVLIKSKVFREVGLLPDEYYMYCEDGDYCQQILHHHFTIYYQPSSKIWHVNSGSSQAGGGAFHDYFLTRNRLIFAAKYASFRTNFALLRESIRLLFSGQSWQKRAVIDFYLGKKGKGSWK